MNWRLVIILLLVPNFLFNCVESRIPSTKLHTFNLNHEKLKMSWVVDWSRKEVLFNIQNVFTLNYNWFYLGFSSRGEFGKSDLCLFQSYNLFVSSMDLYTSTDGKFLNLDDQQDCHLIRQDGNSVAFKRKFDTCDNQDIKMHEGTMYIVWGRGNGFLDFENQTMSKPNIPVKDQGIQFMQILRADKIKIPEMVETFDIVNEDIVVPSKDTTYWCKIQKLSDAFKTKRHIVQFEPIIKNEELVHHMEVFHCDTNVEIEIPLYEGDCDNLPEEAKVCSKVISLWAMGASTFTYPPETGLPIGGAEYNPHIRLETHYNNPKLISGSRDSSGMRIKFSSQLREFDAAVMELGLEYSDKMAIPPGQVGFPLNGYCIAECTKIALPHDGIIVFGSQLHTHLRGARVLTRHIRGDVELPELNRDDFYSHHFQEIRQLRRKPKVLPGDALVTTCYYTTLGYVNATLGGFSIQDEMCVNYIHYYPATKLEVCKSSVSEQTLSDFFKYEKKKLNNPISENYRSLKWDMSLVSQLYTMYVEEPLSFQCNKSDGYRFPGHNWEGAAVTQLNILPPVAERQCEKIRKDYTALEEGLCDLLGECIY